MYNVFKPNHLDVDEINQFIKSSENSILWNETKSSLPTMTSPKSEYGSDAYKTSLVEIFSNPSLVYKQTKNGEPVYLRRATVHPDFIEDGYLTLEYGLINFYDGSKSFIYEQEFWDAWHNYLKDNDYIGWATILAESETTAAYKKGIEMGLFGDDVYYGPMRVKGKIIPGFKKIKVTF